MCLSVRSAHQFCSRQRGTRRYKHCTNFASFELFSIETYRVLYSFTSVANQKSVTYSVSISYFTNIAVQNANKEFVYIIVITDFTASLAKYLNN